MIQDTQCGWCWDSASTVGQTHGGLAGTADGPTNGTCSDWTWTAVTCKQHVDCEGDVSSCIGIFNTNCGWCHNIGDSSNVALAGDSSGPHDGRSCSSWTWDHKDCPAREGPEQVRLSFAGASGETYAITWATPARGTGSFLKLHASALSPGCGNTSMMVQASTTHFTDTNPNGLQYISRAVFDASMARPTPLLAGCPYEYSVVFCVTVDSCEEKGPFSFVYNRMVNAMSDAAPLSVIVYGDMGRYGGAQTLRALKKEIAGNGPTSKTSSVTDAIIHVGDFAYDLHSYGGLVGDTFFQHIEPLAARVPYMTTPGDHETQCLGSPGWSKYWIGDLRQCTSGEKTSHYFSHYRNRFTMPRGMGSNTTGDATGLDMWHSWNLGPVHFISYSSEPFFCGKDFFPSTCHDSVQRMIDWIKADIAAANSPASRALRPWIIAYAHRPMYCSNDDCSDSESDKVRQPLEAILHAGGVDLIIEGHAHSYERLWPVFNSDAKQTYTQNCVNDVACADVTRYDNPSAAVHIVTGSAGCNEEDGACHETISASRGPWSAFWLQTAYTYGRLTVHNSTMLQWQNVVAETERIVDDFWILSDSHGPRPWPDTSTAEYV